MKKATDQQPNMPLSAEAFLRRYRWLVLATWILPVIMGAAFHFFLGLVRFDFIFQTLFAGFSGPFIVVFMVVATIILNRRTREIVELVDEFPRHPEVEDKIRFAARRLIEVHIALFVLNSVVGPQTILLSQYFLYGDTQSPIDWFYVITGMLPPMLLIALPVFFLSTDTLGLYLAPRGIMLDLASLRTKYAVLGLVSPVLVDLTLLLYFHIRHKQ